jgi:amidophosphoribosyltransferase
MCGILGVVAKSPVNQLLYDGLQVLQHRGQDAAGITTGESGRFHMHKGPGLVRDVFRTRNMRNLVGNWGIAHCRYPTAGSHDNAAEAQPFYVNSPFGLMLAHNGNLTNAGQLKKDMFLQDLRHMNTDSDSEVLLNVFAHELQVASTAPQVTAETIFKAVAGVHRRVRGAYAVVAMIAGYGLVAFRDPFGIRPLVIGRNETPQGMEYIVASESVAIDTLGFKLMRDVEPGEVVLVDLQGNFISRQCAERTLHAPCMFEFVYLARPDSVMDGISVYEARARMGDFLADKIRHTLPHLAIDAVIPIPDSSRHSAMDLAARLNLPYREGFVKNRYIGRTFIMQGQ